MTAQVLLAVLTVLNSAATLSFSMSISGGALRQFQAALRTFSSLSVKTGLSALVGDDSLVGEVDMVVDVGFCWVLIEVKSVTLLSALCFAKAAT